MNNASVKLNKINENEIVEGFQGHKFITVVRNIKI